jgi:hypothetical protein
VTAEEWKPIPGFPDYEVSDLGQVASLKRGEREILAGGKTEMGYRNVLLYRDGRRVGRRVHQLVALVFHGPRPEGLVIRHLDGNQLNNAASNLRYGTHEENLADRRRHSGNLLIVGPDRVPNWALRPTCSRGHEWTQENSYVNGGKRFCRQCQAANTAAWRARRALRAANVPLAS